MRRILTLCVVALLVAGSLPKTASAMEFANIDVTGTNDATTVTTVAQGTPDFFMSAGGNFGDFYPRIGTTASDDYAKGIMLSFVRENGRLYGSTTVFAVGNIDGSSSYWIPAHRASSGSETNANIAAAYFPFAEGWKAGYARNATNGGPITTLNASPGISLGTEFVDHSNGQFELYLPGVNSRTDGVLVVNGAKNEANYALSTPSSDGTHFRIGLHDNNANGAVYEQDPVAFAYLPLGAPNVTMGRILGDGQPTLSQGEFSIINDNSGKYRLRIPGQDPTTGVLLVSPEGFVGGNADNIVTYEAVGSEWEIQTRDLNASPPGLENLTSTEPAFSFAFLPTATPPASPGTKPTYDANKVTAANYNVTEFNPNNNSNLGDMYAQASEGSAGMGVWLNNLGDVYIARAGAHATVATGVLLPTIREHERDNSATGGKSGYGMAAASSGIAHIHWAQNAGWAEQNIDFAIACFPHTSGFETGYNVATSGATTTLTVPGSGDTRNSGVLVGTVYSNSDHFMTAEPLGDGSGWNVLTRYKSGSGTSSLPISYAFLPYGTENLVAGHVDANGYLTNKSGQFSLYREGAGLYRLNVLGETPRTGMLLLTATQAGASGDNTLVYRPDGDDFLIQGLDMGPATAASMPEDTDFNFAFIGFDNPPTNPQLRTIPAGALSAGNIRVIQHDTGDTTTSVSAFTAQSTPGLTVHTANKGDYWLSLDGQPLDANAGVLLSSVAQNGRDNGDGTKYATSSTVRDGSANYYVATHEAGTPGTATDFNIDCAAAYFPFAGGWQAGHAYNAAGTNGGANNTLVASPGINLGTEFVDAGGGISYVRLPGVDARTDGLLFANHGKDEGNYAMTRPATDGSEFVIHTHDNGVNGGGTEQDPVAFAYIPFGTPNLTMGRLNGVGAAIASQGEFAIRKAGTGTFELRIPGHDPTTGTLLVTGSAQGVSNDNIISYEAAGDYWLIQTQDLTPPTPQDLGAGDHLCEFAFIPHANAPTAPVARPTFDANKVAAANINITEFNNAGQANTLSVYGQVSEGSAGLGVYGGGNTGDIQIARLGNRLTYSDGVLLASVREHVRDNTATGSGSGYGVVTAWAGYYASTHRAESGDGEHNVDVAVALFPAAAGFAAASGAPTTGGTATLSIPGSGDTRRSGVLMATAAENQPIFSTVQPLSDGSGWAVEVRRVTGALQTYPFNYAFLPYGTDNLVAGQVTDTGYLTNKSGDFTLVREDTGLYRLSIPSESPKTGMLLLTATHGGTSSDNMVVYKADGDDFLIQGLDAGNSSSPNLPADTHFSFAFIGFDNPPANPQLRTLDPRAPSAANIRVIENDAGVGATSVSAYTTQSTPAVTVPDANRGDVYVSIDGVRIAPSQGLTFATIRNNVRDNGAGSVWGISNVYTNAANLNDEHWIPINQTGDNAEVNMDIAVAHFPFAGDWYGAHVASNGSILAAGEFINQSMVARTGTGRYSVTIPGADSRTTGLLFPVLGINSGGVMSAGIMPDGSGWDLRGMDQTSAALDANFSFIFLPLEDVAARRVEGLIAGRIAENGSPLLPSVGDFTISRTGAGQYSLEILGETPETGMLLLNATKMWSGTIPEDNYLTYEADGNIFVIHSHDLGNGVTQSFQDTEFAFAFIPFDDPLFMTPEPATMLILAGGLLALLRRGRRKA